MCFSDMIQVIVPPGSGPALHCQRERETETETERQREEEEGGGGRKGVRERESERARESALKLAVNIIVEAGPELKILLPQPQALGL